MEQAPIDLLALLNRAVALQFENQHQAAIDCYDQALHIQANNPKAWFQRGIALEALFKFEDALKSYQTAITIKPDYAQAFLHEGNVLQQLMRHQEALISYENALRIQPNYVAALINRGNTLEALEERQEGLIHYQRAFDLDPHQAFLLETLLYAKIRVCDWTNLDQTINALINKVKQEDNATYPFPLLLTHASAELQKKSAIRFAQHYQKTSFVPEYTPHYSHKKIHIGYFSGDFHNHATAHLMAELFEKHDKNKFKIFAFSFGPVYKDTMYKRLNNAFDEFINVNNLSDQQAADLAREHEIDIAIDLKGFTQDCRTGIFALRAAPIQINFLGYPGTMGASYIDYIIADPTLIPQEESAQKNYTEKIIYLPHSYQPNDTKRPIADKSFTRAELGLPNTGFVFCCFNNNYKITPDVFSCWMRILHAVPDSVLWLIEDNIHAADNLRKQAQIHNIAPQRLIFAKRMPLAEHLARHRQADLFLDTLPYNAHTTASDALWAGLPVLTHIAETFASRVAASLLNAIGLPELITHTQEEYEQSAIRLAKDPIALNAIKDKLAKQRDHYPLFDTTLFTKHLEQSYRAAFNNYQQQLAPQHIIINP